MTLSFNGIKISMNLKLFFLLFFTNFFLNTYIFSQDTTFNYLNKDWKKCKKIEATYYRKLYKNNNLWMVEDYYISGQIQMTGSYLKKNMKVREGDFIYYYEDGQISTKYHITKNLFNGNYMKYYENGVISREGKYVQDLLEGEWITYYKNGNVKSLEEYKNSKYNGDCYWYFKNSQMSSHESYTMNELNSIEFWNEDGTSYAGEPEVDVQANFVGGYKEMLKFIQENVVYPEKALKRGVKGRVIIKFVINTEGEISKAEVVKSVHPLLDKEALRVIMLMPEWNPGMEHNIPVNSYFRIPINFTF
jgi:TonB family protein